MKTPQRLASIVFSCLVLFGCTSGGSQDTAEDEFRRRRRDAGAPIAADAGAAPDSAVADSSTGPDAGADAFVDGAVVTHDASAGDAGGPSGVLVARANLQYLGVSHIRHGDGSCADTPNARATGLTYNPLGNNGAGSFYLTGRNATHCIAEITKPALGGTATFLQDYRDPTNGTVNGVPGSGEAIFVGGHLLHNGSLYVSAFTYYDAGAEQDVAIWRRSPTLADNAGLVGPFAVGPGNQGMYNQYMDNVPPLFQSMLGGPAVIGGCCFSIISRTSLGPALYAFDPERLGPVTALVGYPAEHQTLNPWGAPGSHPEANPTTKIGGVTFIEGSDTVLFVGNSGTGSYCYGTSCVDPDNPGIQGAHAYPYVHYAWAYDVKELAQVRAGARQMWDVLPYAHWELSDLGSVGDEWSAIGVAFDASTSHLYVLRSREMDGSAWPQLHVYRVAGLNR